MAALNVRLKNAGNVAKTIPAHVVVGTAPPMVTGKSLYEYLNVPEGHTLYRGGSPITRSTTTSYTVTDGDVFWTGP